MCARKEPNCLVCLFAFLFTTTDNSSLPQFINICIDSGSRVTVQEFQEQLDFAKQIVNDLKNPVGGMNSSRVALTVFGSTAETVIDTDQMTHVTTPSLLAAISQLTYTDRGTEDLASVLLEAANLQPPEPPVPTTSAMYVTTPPPFSSTEFDFNASSNDTSNFTTSYNGTMTTVHPMTASSTSAPSTSPFGTGFTSYYSTSFYNGSFSFNTTVNITNFTTVFTNTSWVFNSSSNVTSTSSFRRYSVDYEPPELIVCSRATTRASGRAILESRRLQARGVRVRGFSCGRVERFDLVTFGESETAPSVLTIASEPISRNGFTLSSFGELSTVGASINISVRK